MFRRWCLETTTMCYGIANNTQNRTIQHNITPHHTTHTISQLALLFYSQLFGSVVCCSLHLHCNVCLFLSLLNLFSLSKHFTSMIIFIEERARDPIKLILKFIYSWVNFVTTVSTKSTISKCKKTASSFCRSSFYLCLIRISHHLCFGIIQRNIFAMQDKNQYIFS